MELLQGVGPVLRLLVAELDRLVLVERQMQLLEVAEHPDQALDRRPGDPGAVEHEVTEGVVLAVFDLCGRIGWGVSIAGYRGGPRGLFFGGLFFFLEVTGVSETPGIFLSKEEPIFMGLESNFCTVLLNDEIRHEINYP